MSIHFFEYDFGHSPFIGKGGLGYKPYDYRSIKGGVLTLTTKKHKVLVSGNQNVADMIIDKVERHSDDVEYLSSLEHSLFNIIDSEYDNEKEERKDKKDLTKIRDFVSKIKQNALMVQEREKIIEPVKEPEPEIIPDTNYNTYELIKYAKETEYYKKDYSITNNEVYSTGNAVEYVLCETSMNELLEFITKDKSKIYNSKYKTTKRIGGIDYHSYCPYFSESYTNNEWAMKNLKFFPIDLLGKDALFEIKNRSYKFDNPREKTIYLEISKFRGYENSDFFTLFYKPDNTVQLNYTFTNKYGKSNITCFKMPMNKKYFIIFVFEDGIYIYDICKDVKRSRFGVFENGNDGKNIFEEGTVNGKTVLFITKYNDDGSIRDSWQKLPKEMYEYYLSKL